MRIEFTVPGAPVAKARPKVTRFGTYTPKKTMEYERLVRQCWEEQSGVRLKSETPLKMKVVCYMPIPKSLPKKIRSKMPGKPHIKRPDTDNIVKAITDALQDKTITKKDRKTKEKIRIVQENAFADDSCIYQVMGAKIYSFAPRVHVTIEEDLRYERP